MLQCLVILEGGIYTSVEVKEEVIWTDRTAASGSKEWYAIASSSDGSKLAAVADGEGIYTGVFQ